MNRFKIRLHALMMIGLVGLLASVLSGCGAGQVSQTAMQEPAVNGNRLTITNAAQHHSVELRDIRIQASQSKDFIDTGQTVELVLVAVNQSPLIADRLLEITSDIAKKVEITGDARLQPNGMLCIGAAQCPRVAPGPQGSDNAAKAVLTLSKPISNGLLYSFTFKFESAGEGSVTVPISAGPAPPHV